MSPDQHRGLQPQTKPAPVMPGGGRTTSSLVRRTLMRLAPRSYSHYRTFVSLQLDGKSYLHATGWLRSFREEMPVDADGRPIPWMNYPAICFLRGRLARHLALFEYGCGNSTLFFAGLVGRVTSVEHDGAWLEDVRRRAGPNVELLHVLLDADGNYCRAARSTGRQYDVIVVDGRDRVNCLKQSISALSETGVLILDDSEREKYREGIDFVRGHGFRSLDFEGLKPTHFDASRMTVLYRSGRNCLEL